MGRKLFLSLSTWLHDGISVGVRICSWGLGSRTIKIIYILTNLFINKMLYFDTEDITWSLTALRRPVDNRSLFIKSQQNGLTLFTGGCAPFVAYSSPLRRRSFTLKLSCCHILEPLLCMSSITLIHSDHWLLHTSLGELLPTACNVTEGTGKEVSAQ